MGGWNLHYLYQIKPDGKVNKINYLNKIATKDCPVPQSMVEDSTGIWIGCSHNYLIYYNFKSHKFITKVSSPLIVDYSPF